MDHAKAVQVQVQHGKGVGRLTPALQEDPFQPVEKQGAVRQTGEGIVKRFQKEPLLGLPLLLDQPFAFQRLRHRMPEPGETIFQQVVRRPGLHAFHGHILADASGDDDERQIEPALVEQVQGFAGRELRHGIVGEDEVRRLIQFAEIGGLGVHSPALGIESRLPQRLDHQFRIGGKVFE